MAVGKNLLNYDSLLVYAHFKGHAMGGFGGSLYAPWGNLAIFYRDFGYSNGLIILGKIDGGIESISAPGPVKVTVDPVRQEIGTKGRPELALERPTPAPVTDGVVHGLPNSEAQYLQRTFRRWTRPQSMVYALPDTERRDMVERIESRNGLRQLEFMKTLNMGNDRYELIRL